MPAMGASTTGVSTVSDPRVSAEGRADMFPIVRGAPGPTQISAVVGLPAAVLPPGARLVLHDVAGPRDGVEALRGAEADRDQRAALRREVDQAHLRGGAGRERLR